MTTAVSDLAELAGLYRDLHAHPELAFAEHRTAGLVAARLRDLGYQVTEGVGRTGVVGVLRNGDGPAVLLRADMDALPVREQTGLPYACTTFGADPHGRELPVMHACGHDMHVTCLLGAAAELADGQGSWRGTLLLVFQPAEETVTSIEEATAIVRGLPSNHSPWFAPVIEPTLRTGVTALTCAARAWLAPPALPRRIGERPGEDLADRRNPPRVLGSDDAALAQAAAGHLGAADHFGRHLGDLGSRGARDGRDARGGRRALRAGRLRPARWRQTTAGRSPPASAPD